MSKKVNTAGIILTIGETDFKFTPSVADHNNYTNELMPDNKIAPAHQFLTRTVLPEQQADLVVFVQLNQVLASNDHNVILCLGATNGMDLNAGTNASGAAFADMNGYDWTFEGQEFAPMLTVADYTTVPFDNTAFNGGTPIPVVTS